MIKQHFLLIFSAILLFTACGTQKSAVATTPGNSLTADEQQRFDYYFYEALRLKNTGDPGAQMEALRMCLEIDSTSGAVQSESGHALAQLNSLPEATRAFNKAVMASPTNWWYRVQLISMLSGTEQYAEAITHAVALSKIYPEREAVYNMLSSLYKQTGEYDKAIYALDKLESFVGINEYLSFEKFQLYAALNKAKKATAEIDRLVEKYPAETRYQVLRGDIFMDQKQPEKAFEVYQQVLASDPSNPFVYVSLANYYKEKNQPEKALESIVSALKNPALPSDTKMDILGQYVDKLLGDNQKIAETEELFKLLVEMYPLDEMPHAYYAHFLQNQKRMPEALSELESVININPKNEAAWVTSLQILADKEDTVAILDLTERGIRELPKIPQFYFYRSMAQYQQGNYEAALQTNEEALKNVDTAPASVISSFYGQIGDIWYKLSNKEKAFANYEKALEQNPGNVYVMNNYAYYLSEEKLDLRKAERMSGKTVELEPKNSTYLDTYAWILYQQGNYSLAKFYIERAVDNLEKEHDPGVILEHYGDILQALNDRKKAVEIWQKALDAGITDEALKAKIEKTKQEIDIENESKNK